MPQTSPMNWLMITMMFFFMVNIILTKSKWFFKKEKQSTNFFKIKNIIWKW